MSYQAIFSINTSGREIIDITDKVNAVVKKANTETGICNVFIRHTSASLMITENADRDVLRDIEYFFKKNVIDDDINYHHKMEGFDDMSGHIRTILTDVSKTIPITNFNLSLGTWQGIFLYEHRAGSFNRKIIVTICK